MCFEKTFSTISYVFIIYLERIGKIEKLLVIFRLQFDNNATLIVNEHL